MKKMIKLSLLAAAISTLAACAATPEECDPNAPMGLFGKIACASSGSYDQRISDKEQQLQIAEAHNSQLQRANQVAKNKAAQSAAKLKNKRAELNKLNNSLAQSATQLKAKAQGNAQILQQIEDVEKQIRNVNHSSSSDEAKQAELQKLQRQLAAYQKALGL